MERTISVEEKIRRAEEIYNRRIGNSNGYIYENRKENIKKGPSLASRMIKQIIICILIYGLFYVVTNREYFLSQEFLDKVRQVASQNETTKNAYEWAIKYLEKYINIPNKTENQEMQEQTNQTENAPKNIEENNMQTEQTSKLEGNETNINSNDENIGGSNEEIAQEEKTQEQKDVEKIKNTINFINPIEGTISSTFGWRTPTTKTVPKYHTGLDIAASTGTVIKSATDGKVTLVSSYGDYGKHYKIQIDDITIIYAHCSKLYLNEGDLVTRGQEIAEVGSTGNSTRTPSAF